MKGLILLGEALILGALYYLWRREMATKQEILQTITDNQTTALTKIGEVRTRIDLLISQGGGGATPQDLDDIATAISETSAEVVRQIDGLKTGLPGGDDL